MVIQNSLKLSYLECTLENYLIQPFIAREGILLQDWKLVMTFPCLFANLQMEDLDLSAAYPAESKEV